ncbi:DUF6325 family protein [Nocardioides albus]|uniref:DUF1269 domain-containing protein n=1 Tax=Nocardioides albus TaxID=1841 RepID=A0A7W5A823_9ACTN|nr:DUF6325 family protein [Nocardioides albus]MBB3091100.1 hypothetical protein [Nocardioides albus]GGU34341.1 hypothetical protein GCM10007979_36850 [Nocardioides albus]
MERGPVEILFLSMSEEVGLNDLAAVLRPPVESGVIRIIDCVLMSRDADGSLRAVDIEEAEGLPAELAGLQIDANDLLSDADIDLFAASLAPGRAGLAVVYEQVWARETVSRIRSTGAEVELFLRVPPEDVDLAFASAAS